MKRIKFSRKIVGLLCVLMLSCTAMNGAEYRGDQSPSPFMRFLRGLFWGGSGTSTHFDRKPQGKSYQFSSLSIGSSKTGASATDQIVDQSGGSVSGGELAAPVSPRKSALSSRASVSSNSRSSVSAAIPQANTYVSPLSTAAAATAVVSNSSSSFSSSSDVASVAMPSMATIQQASPSSMTLATTATTGTSNATTPYDDGFGSNGNGAADPVIPTPVGDGSWVLLFLASAYVYLKRKRLFNRISHI